MHIVYNLEPEEQLAAVATISAYGAQLAAQRTTADQFHDPRCARVVDVATRIGDHHNDRVAVVADAAHVEPAWLRQLVHDSPVMWDLTGAIAARVRTEAHRRARIHQLIAELDQIATAA